MKRSILGKNIKVTVVNEEAKPKGLTDTEKVQKESGKFNKEAMGAYTKLKDLYDFDDSDEDALENPPKYTRGVGATNPVRNSATMTKTIAIIIAARYAACDG